MTCVSIAVTGGIVNVSKGQPAKAGMGKWDYTKQTFPSKREDNRRRHGYRVGEIFVNYVTEKRLISGKYDEFEQLKSLWIKKKIANDLNRHFLR